MIEFQKYIDLLSREVKPALGCTEPIAVSLAVARGCEELRAHGEEPTSIEVQVSSNILKNGMGVGIPATGMVGLHIASALGAVCGKSALKLEVLNCLNSESIARAKEMVDQNMVKISIADTEQKLYVKATCKSSNHTTETTIENRHDAITMVTCDGVVIQSTAIESDSSDQQRCTDFESRITVRSIYDFATTVPYADIAQILESATMNRAIANEGLDHVYGLQVGRTIREHSDSNIFGNSVLTYSMALTAAASDARMAGSSLPAMSNSGSGNQGITATLPVVAVAEKLGSSDEQLARALVISHLISIHIKKSLGRLSALCGCVVASSGSSCGIVYLMDGSYEQMTYAIKNMIGNVTGMVCDGAKIGCALKVSSGVSASIQSATLAMQGICVSENDGIIDRDIERTITNLATIGTKGMEQTDRMMLDIMVNKKRG